jgi:hypothetical protein
VSNPTIADEKILITAIDGALKTELNDLSPGTVYYIRAFATNDIGTAYGDIVSFTTDNIAPEAREVNITGSLATNTELTVNYTYFDAEGDVESGTTFQWYVAKTATGTDEESIPDATEGTYTIRPIDDGMYICVGVTPRASTGTILGEEVKSSFIGPIGESTEVTFTYNGQTVTYGTINSKITGRKWLDRNLGAAAVPTAMDDYKNYGDLFQWGRLADGHQLISRKDAYTMALVNSPIGTWDNMVQSSTDDPGHNHFIIVNMGGTGDKDWRVPQNPELWQGPNGTNNPCPSGWRLPTLEEWTSEKLGDLADGFAKLRLTYTGRVFPHTGNIETPDLAGYWSSSISTVDPTQSRTIIYYKPADKSFQAYNNLRSESYACRCIKN